MRYKAKEQIREMQPSDHLIYNKVKSQLNQLQSSVDLRLREDVKLNLMSEKAQFEKDYYKLDLIMDVMDKDKDFK